MVFLLKRKHIQTRTMLYAKIYGRQNLKLYQNLTARGYNLINVPIIIPF